MAEDFIKAFIEVGMYFKWIISLNPSGIAYIFERVVEQVCPLEEVYGFKFSGPISQSVIICDIT